MSDASGLTIVLSPVQLQAVLSSSHLSASEMLTNRLWGGAKLLGGALELVGGAAFLLAPEPTMATKVAGGALLVHGTDTTGAAIRQVWSGQSTETFTEQGAEAGARLLGATDKQARIVGTVVDVGVPLVATLGASVARIAAIRAGRIVLAEEEAAGGHTIARHVAQTEQQLQTRLIAEPRITAASSFASVDAAETAISDALRMNSSAIRSWATTSGNASTFRIVYSARSAIGYGIVRAAGKLQEMQNVVVVLRKTQQAGKVYFVLTAYPAP